MKSDGDEDAIIRAIEHALDQNNPNRAMRLLNVVQEAESRDVTLWIRVAYSALNSEQFQQALEAAHKAVSIDPMSANAHTVLGHCFEELGLMEQAENAFTRGIELSPSDPRYVFLGVSKRRLGKDDEAEIAFRSALWRNGKNEEAAFNLAVCLREKSPDEAMSLLKQAVHIAPDYADAYREMSFILGRSGQYAEAILCARNAIRHNPEDAWSWVYIAAALAEIQEHDEAERAYLKAIELDPTEPAFCFLLGNYYRHLCIIDKAVRAYQSAIDLDPENLKYKSSIAIVTQEQHRGDKALDGDAS
ncbi:lipoprotein NlpI [Phycisphaerae bacterium RAS2]|nr:lipoprotein NlpI [Phycisphaerae bacterium RAS2]